MPLPQTVSMRSWICSYAATVEPLKMTGPVGDQFPAGTTVKATYRAKGDRPGFATYWYEGKNKDGSDNMPETPEELKADGLKLPRTENLNQSVPRARCSSRVTTGTAHV